MLDPLWFFVPRPRPEAGIRLYCFAHAGGGASVYRGWPDLLGAGVEVAAVRLPGRESRFPEAPYRKLTEAAAGAAAALRADPDPRPFAFFGHSLGALLAFETARELARDGGPGPVHLIASGCPAPGEPFEPLGHGLPDDEFVDGLRKLGGLPEEVLEHPDLLRLLLPTIRADVEMVETYRPQDAPDPGLRLACPVTVLGGRDDVLVRKERLETWQDVTGGTATTRLLPGGHFFVAEEPELTREAVLESLRDA